MGRACLALYFKINQVPNAISTSLILRISLGFSAKYSSRSSASGFPNSSFRT